jgi:hypothetical protein
VSVALIWILFKEIAFKKTNGDATVIKFMPKHKFGSVCASLWILTIMCYTVCFEKIHLSICPLSACLKVGERETSKIFLSSFLIKTR